MFILFRFWWLSFNWNEATFQSLISHGLTNWSDSIIEVWYATFPVSNYALWIFFLMTGLIFSRVNWVKYYWSSPPQKYLSTLFLLLTAYVFLQSMLFFFALLLMYIPLTIFQLLCRKDQLNSQKMKRSPTDTRKEKCMRLIRVLLKRFRQWITIRRRKRRRRVSIAQCCCCSVFFQNTCLCVHYYMFAGFLFGANSFRNIFYSFLFISIRSSLGRWSFNGWTKQKEKKNFSSYFSAVGKQLQADRHRW